MNFYLDSLGCRLNQSEIQALERALVAAGHVVVAAPERAAVCVLNTCAVTAAAERKSRHRLRALARANPQARIAALGCYATLAPETCAALPGVAWVIPNDEKEQTVGLIAPAPASQSADKGLSRWRTRAFVKVQDGCDNHCTYCLTRILRGPSRSRPLEEVVTEVQTLADAGYREAVLTGVNLGSYGHDRGQSDGLRHLVAALLAHTDIPRLRLSSLEPWAVDEDFFRLWENPRLCRQIHLPLQAGHDETLRRMGRRITTARFARLVEAARAAIPDAAITTDIIVGFPGEDETAFRAGYEFVAALGFARLHVFPYSPRPGTPAAAFPDQVPHAERERRARRMRALGDALAARFRRRFVGRRMAVLWESRRDGHWQGLTDNYLRVVAPADADLNLHGRIVPARLLAVQGAHLIGEVLG